jgi:FkbM family methyltransferase
MLRNTIRSIYSRLPAKQHIFTLVRSVWRPPESIYRHLHFKGRFRFPAGDSSFQMQHYGFQLENDLFWNREGYEPCSTRIWTRLCASSSVIVDVGANTGFYALAAQCVNPDATVIAFEPVKRVFSKLRHNVELNRYPVICVEKAASDTTGPAVIYDNDSAHTYSVTVNKNLGTANAHRVEIETVRLDDFFASTLPSLTPDLLKIDVETHEPEVLAGMGRLLQKRPALLIEVLNDDVGKGIERATAGLGYLFFRIGDKAEPATSLTGGYALNYLLCQQHHRELLGL